MANRGCGGVRDGAKRLVFRLATISNVIIFLCVSCFCGALQVNWFGRMPRSLLDLVVRNIDGLEEPLSKYKGKVLLIVNVASKCGYTPQYQGLQELQEKYQDRGFTVIGFPCNSFLWQEPQSCPLIKKFTQDKYSVTFPLMDKVEVNGRNESPVFQILKEYLPGRVWWNFNKFLVNRDGIPIKRYGSGATPQQIEPDIVNAL